MKKFGIFSKNLHKIYKGDIANFCVISCEKKLVIRQISCNNKYIKIGSGGRTVTYAENSNIKIDSEKIYKTMYIYAGKRQNSAYVYIVLSYY